MSTTIPTKGREFEIAHEVTYLMDELTPEQQRQVMAMLLARYELKVVRLASENKKRFQSAPRSGPTKRV